MGQVRGSEARFTLYEENPYLTPGASGTVLYLTGFTVKGTRGKHDSAILGSGRKRKKGKPGNLDVGGGLPTELGPESLGKLLKHALGRVDTFRPVAKQPTNVTGVTVRHAAKGAPLGAGTLSFTAAGTTLSWQAQGDTAGSAVDVSAGGDFALASGTPGGELYVTVAAGSLPGADASDADIGVHAAYKHEFRVDDLPPGFALEKDHGGTIEGAGRFVLYKGCRIAQLALSFPADGIPTVSVDVKGADKELAATAIDGTPDDYGHESFSAFEIGTLEEGGTEVGTVTEMNLTIANELDESGYTIGSNGKRRQLPEGMSTVSGSITALFEDLSLYSKMMNGTESALRCRLERGTGLGDAGNEALEVYVGPLVYEEDDTEISGPGGVVISPNFTAFDDAILVTLFNSVADI